MLTSLTSISPSHPPPDLIDSYAKLPNWTLLGWMSTDMSHTTGIKENSPSSPNQFFLHSSEWEQPCPATWSVLLYSFGYWDVWLLGPHASHTHPILSTPQLLPTAGHHHLSPEWSLPPSLSYCFSSHTTTLATFWKPLHIHVTSLL